MNYKLLINMKATLCILMLFCFVQEFQAQNNSGYRIIRSNLGSSGSSQNIETNKGNYKVSQSIGQSSVIGTHSRNGYYLRQGYQQPSSEIKVVKEFDTSLNAKIYPNPFNKAITITFSDEMKNNISVLMFDVRAKLIHAQEFLPAQQVKLNIKNLSTGSYFLKVEAGRKQFQTKLIKI